MDRSILKINQIRAPLFILVRRIICTGSLKSIQAPFFLNLRKFEKEGETPEKYGIKSLEIQEINQHDSGCLVDLFPVQTYRCLKKFELLILLRLLIQML